MGKAPLQLLAMTTVAVIQLHLLLFSLNFPSSRQSGRKQTTAKLASRGETGRRRRRCESIPQSLFLSFVSVKC